MDLISVSPQIDSIFKTRIRKHSFLSDMSIQDGGTDTAPSPAELLVSSLGFCIAMIIQRYCKSHGLSEKGINLSMTYLLTANPKMITSITIDIALPENFPPNKKKAILNAVKTCVIYNSLNDNVEIDIDFEN